ncbi:MAG: ankyrin repeat domain-containing protein [Bdellovibrionaceae bacterium]|nr:ankyrin repeat domain-containing protein [Pseudobdellovibrionaceae bacterium]
MKTIALLLAVCLFTACSKNEAEYYGYAKKNQDSQTRKIELSSSEKISRAIRNDEWDTLHALLQQGLSLNKILDSGRTLLNESVLWDRESIFRNLIQLGADPKTKDETGIDTHEMCMDKINFRILLDPSLQGPYQDEFFSHLENDDPDELKRLLEQKMNPNFLFASGETPLTYAVGNNLENCVRLLINNQFKTDVHMKNVSGKTALTLARELNLKRIEKLLTGRGARF